MADKNHPDPHAILAEVRRIKAAVPSDCDGTYTLRLADAEALAEMACTATPSAILILQQECEYWKRLAAKRRGDVTASAATLDRVQRVAEVRAKVAVLAAVIQASKLWACEGTARHWYETAPMFLERELTAQENALTALRRELAELGEEESRG